MEKKAAYIYVMTNKTFSGHNWVKIGYAKDVEKRRRQLSTTNIPYPYEVYATYEIPESEHLGDKVLHKLITNLNPSLRLTTNREFFEMTPEQAFELLRSLAIIHNRESKLVACKENLISQGDKEPSRKQPKIETPSNTQKEGEVMLFHSFKEGTAKLVMDFDSFILLKDSAVKINLNDNNPEKKRQLETLNNGVLVGEDGEFGKVIEDIAFASSSAAAKYVAGSSQSGMVYWKTKEGLTLKQLLENED